MKVKIDIFAAIILSIVHSTFSEHILSCNVTDLGGCPDNEICVETSKQCVCMEGFVRVVDECIKDVPGRTDHDTTAVVVSIFTIALILCGLVLVVRKYKLIEYIRQKINSRRNNDIMYEDVMIGQDDPPLNP